MDLNKFYEWQQEKPQERWLSIKSDPVSGVYIWVYDQTLMAGQRVHSVEEIDLEGKKEAEERAKYEALKAKYEEAI